jgi:hypothetical protein
MPSVWIQLLTFNVRIIAKLNVQVTDYSQDAEDLWFI